MSTIPASAPSTTPDVSQRMERIQRQLADWKQSSQRSSNMLLVLGFGSILLLSVYFIYIYREFNSFLQPEILVNLAQDFSDSQLPVARQQLEAELKRAAPGLAEGLSKQAVSSMPAAREKLVEYILAQIDDVAQQTLNITEDEFRGYLRGHRAELESAYKAMAKSPAEAEARLAEVRKGFEEQLEGSTEWHAQDLLKTLTDMNEKLALLSANKKLTKEEQLERRILMLTRSLQKEKLSTLASAEPVAERTE